MAKLDCAKFQTLAFAGFCGHLYLWQGIKRGAYAEGQLAEEGYFVNSVDFGYSEDEPEAASIVRIVRQLRTAAAAHGVSDRFDSTADEVIPGFEVLVPVMAKKWSLLTYTPRAIKDLMCPVYFERNTEGEFIIPEQVVVGDLDMPKYIMGKDTSANEDYLGKEFKSMGAHAGLAILMFALDDVAAGTKYLNLMLGELQQTFQMTLATNNKAHPVYRMFVEFTKDFTEAKAAKDAQGNKDAKDKGADQLVAQMDRMALASALDSLISGMGKLKVQKFTTVFDQLVQLHKD